METKDIEKIANLARLTLSQNEIQKLTKDLSEILNYIETLNELDLDDIKPTAHAVKVDNVFRKDEVAQNSAIQDTLPNAPDHDDEFFLVPKVIDA